MPPSDVMSFSSYRDKFLFGAAQAFFCTAYADYVENEDNNLPRPGPGEDWTDFCPPLPPHAYALAGELWANLEHANSVSVYALAERAEKADGHEPDWQDFGHYLAMESMGHGVSWFDNHKRFEIKVPYKEVSYFNFDYRAFGADDDGDE